MPNYDNWCEEKHRVTFPKVLAIIFKEYAPFE